MISSLPMEWNPIRWVYLQQMFLPKRENYSANFPLLNGQNLWASTRATRLRSSLLRLVARPPPT